MGNRKVKSSNKVNDFGVTFHEFPIIEEFKLQMLRKLVMNKHKGGWENDSISMLFERLIEETSELREAINTFDGLPQNLKDQREIKEAFKRIIQLEAADVANFAMMVFDNARQITEEEE